MDLTRVYLAGTKASDVALIHERLTQFLEGQRLINSPSLSVTNKQDARDLAATSQHVFEQITLALVRRLVLSVPGTKGIVLSGGCALNVKFSALVVEEFSRQQVFISSAPGDTVQMPGARAIAHARTHARTHARLHAHVCI
jgi:predicted NodU family carbamoyl transferase